MTIETDSLLIGDKEVIVNHNSVLRNKIPTSKVLYIENMKVDINKNTPKFITWPFLIIMILAFLFCVYHLIKIINPSWTLL